MSKKYKPISTLEYYNFHEQNNFNPAKGCDYKVKVSDKEGNIITIEKDGSLFAMVGLSLNGGQLLLLDKAHDDSVLAEVEFPNAGKVTNCKFDEETNSIEFDILTLNGETQTVSIDVQSLVDIYEAGDGIEIGEKNPETGKKPISIKLADEDGLLKISESGLSISDEVATDEELIAAISGKADADYVNDLISGITDDIEHIYDILGTDEDDPNLDERIDSKADLDEFNDLEDEVGEIERDLNELSGKVESLEDAISGISSITETVEELSDKVDTISGDVESLSEKVDTISGDLESLSAKVEDNEVEVIKITSGLPENVREAYVVINKLGEQLGDRIDIYYDSTIVSIDYLPEEQIIRYVYINSKGEEVTVDIDLSKIVIESEFADGLQVNDGVVSVKIDPTSDGYLTVSGEGIKLSGIAEFLASLVEVNNQQWTVINQNRADLEAVDQQIWAAIGNEATLRENADNALSNRIDNLQTSIDDEARQRQEADENLANAIEAEKDRAVARENEIDAKVDAEKARAEAAEQALSGAIATEKEQRERADNALSGAIDDERSERRNADIALSNRITNLDNRIIGFETNLSAETAARIQRDEELTNDIAEIQRTYVTKDYVDAQDRQVYNDAVNSAVTSSNQYTDNAIDEVENELKEYSDEGDTELQQAISTNTTKINAISNLLGVIGDDTSNYDDSGNGILDVLHREFHEYVKNAGTIKEITFEDGNLIITYETREGEKTIEIPISELVDLSDYYKKEETDALLDEKADVSAITDVESSLLERIDQLNQYLNDEFERATSAETELHSEITNLESTFEERINQLNQLLNEERQRAEGVEEELQGADIASGAISSELVVTVTQNNGNVITFDSPEKFELEAGEF